MNYNIATEGQLSIILSNIDSDLTIAIINDIITRRPNDYDFNPKNNIPARLEVNFKRLLIDYAFEKDTINETREEIYLDIIETITKRHGLKFNPEGSQDLYSSIYYIYDFLISNFNQYLIKFFVNFITKEKNNLYFNLKNINELKKSKDSSTVYNKKIYKNGKLALIAANLEYVINIICTMDIPFNEILNDVYDNQNIIKLLSSVLIPVYDFFGNMYKPLFNSSIKPLLLTEIRLNLQKSMTEDDMIFNNISKDEDEIKEDNDNTNDGGLDYE